MSTKPIRIAVVGLGKIARDQHLPKIAASADFELAALVSSTATEGDIPVYRTLEAALAADPNIDAVALCTPPQVRLELCQTASRHKCAILLEKPPAATTDEAEALKRIADDSGCVIFASWHSRFAAKVAEATAWCQSHPLRSGAIEWREDAMKWHPGQTWLWQEGGFGVFDPGINALSILTQLYPLDWSVSAPCFDVPSNSGMPMAAKFRLVNKDAKVDVALDFGPTETETWAIHLEAVSGETLDLTQGGASLSVNGSPAISGEDEEYAGLYRRFAALVRAGQSDFDTSPLEIVTAAFNSARVSKIAPIPFL